MNYKIRESVTRKIPYTIILGDKEKDDNLISYRMYGSNETNTLSKLEFIDMIKELIKNKK